MKKKLSKDEVDVLRFKDLVHHDYSVYYSTGLIFSFLISIFSYFQLGVVGSQNLKLVIIGFLIFAPIHQLIFYYFRARKHDVKLMEEGVTAKTIPEFANRNFIKELGIWGYVSFAVVVFQALLLFILLEV